MRGLMPVRLGSIAAGLLLALLAAAPAAAQSNVAKQVDKLNRKALDDYDSLEFDSARETLQTALNKLREAGLDDTPTAAQTHLNLGIVYVAGFKDHNRGVQQFVLALRVDPTIRLDPLRGTPELQEAFDEAAKQASGMHKTPDLTPAPMGIVGLVHTPVDEARSGTAVVVKVRVGADVKASWLVLHYRGGGKDEFTAVRMNAVGDEWSAAIPASAMTGKAVQYYIEAKDARGQALAVAGSAPSPYIISVSGETKVADKDGGPAPTKEGRGFGRLYLDVMLGTGLGIEPAGNHVDVAYQYSPDTGQYRRLPVFHTGVVSAPLHIGAEFGVQITRHIALGLLGRFQVYTGANADSSVNPPLGGGTKKAFGAAAGLLRFRYQFLTKRFHPYIHVDIGGGYIRHMMDISGGESSDRPLVDFTTADAYNRGTIGPNDPVNEVCSNHASCTDSITIGYFLVGGGVGLWYDMMKFYNGGLGFVTDLNILAAVGEQFGVNFDLQIGLGVHFL